MENPLGNSHAPEFNGNYFRRSTFCFWLLAANILFESDCRAIYLGDFSGAKLTVALAMIFFLGQGRLLSAMALIGVAFFGSMLSMGFILLISGKVHRMSILIICGVMIGYICSAITDFVVTFADDSNIVNLHNWSMGSFASSSWQDLRAMSMVVFPVLIGTFFLSKPMGAYQLGEAYAQNLGVPIRLFRVALILLSSLLSACVTAFAGPISLLELLFHI